MKELLLHQLLAFESAEVSKSKKAVEELKNAFANKQIQFDGHSRVYVPDNENYDRVDNEYREVVSTVNEKLSAFSKVMAQAMDTVLAKEETNSSGTAKAELIVDGVNFGEFAATSLLYLEKVLLEVKKVLESILTLHSGIAWNFNSDTGLYQTDKTVTYRNLKEIVPIVLYEATKEHPAQVKESSRTVKVGEYHENHFSGRIFQKKKNEILDRMDLLIKEVKSAREKANAVPVKEVHVANKILKFIMEE
jgi:hypothetical protein